MNQLILHPRDVHTPLDPTSLIDLLTGIGFIAGHFNFQGHTHYRPGENFLELMTFLGCSPVIALGEPGPTGEDFCHVSLLPLQEQVTIMYGANVKTPRCPHCRHPLAEWQAVVKAWEEDRQHYLHRCPACSHTMQLPQLKWRQSAGFLRTGIAVWGIYEGEAVPNEQLLAALEQAIGQSWSYFYLRR